MKLLHKLAIGLSVPSAVVAVGGWMHFQRASDLLRSSIHMAAEVQANAAIGAVDETLSQYVRQWRGFLADTDTQRALLAAGARYPADADPEAWIDQIDAGWKNSASESAVAAKRASHDHPLSGEMRERAFLSREASEKSIFGEVFLTDARGANLAQTGDTSDFRQNDESWWQIAHERGAFLGEVEWDDSLADYGLPLALRADSPDGRFLGVIKIVLRASALAEFFDALAPEASVWQHANISLVSRDGQDIHRHGSAVAEREWLAALLATASSGRANEIHHATVHDADRERLVFVAGRPILAGAGWWAAVVEHDTAELFAPMRSLAFVAAIATSITILIIIGAAGAATCSIVGRLKALREATVRLAGGGAGVRLAMSGNDEIAELGRAFDDLAIELDVNEQQRLTYMATLERGNAAMRDEMNRRKQLENQLVQAQKLESIGQLAAGVAHEINTPMQYVADNIRFLNESFEGLLKVIAAYTDATSAPDDDGLRQRLVDAAAVAADADLAFLRAEVPTALTQSIEGVAHIADIVRAMKGFSHPGSEAKEPSDLNNAIESTVVVCRHKWKYVADVQLDLLPGLPKVPCYLGEFNQVILNLIVNAADAIADVVGDGSERRGSIRIATRRDGEHAVITVVDSGAGIPDEIKNRIFDPFFTTKGVGKGTGQGLAICHNTVVTRHAGAIAVESTPGVGTSFTIRLPLQDPARASEPRKEAA